MKEAYKNYYDHFSRLNAGGEKSFETSYGVYNLWYEKFMPEDKSAKVLDIGCGMGHFLYFLKQKGYDNFLGIDISEPQINFCRENISDKVMVADAFDFLKSNSDFDIIFVHDVIEHQPKEKLLEFLRLILGSLKTGGVVFIKTDNMANPFGLLERYIDITHEVGFTEQSLRASLEIAGFHEIDIMGTPFVLRNSLKSMVASLARYLTRKILICMFRVQGYPIPKILDKSIIAIAKKK